MSDSSPPPSQKADVRPISFVLIDQVAGNTTSIDLFIRPEELTRTEVSRLTVQQTLDGAFADNFGPGVAMINMAGHTGWRAGPNGGSGESRFKELKSTVFDNWHEKRNNAVKAGQDPELIQLRLSDSLDDFTDVVAPQSFVLRRSRSRPLLMQFQISLYVLNTPTLVAFDSGGLLGAIGSGDMSSLSFSSISASITSIKTLADQARNFINQNILVPVQGFMNQSATIFDSVRGAIGSVVGVAQSLITTARDVALAGVNIFRTIASIANLPSTVKGLALQTVSAYTNIFCLLSNAIRSPLTYEDYGSLYGMSGCSSTAGGRSVSAFAGENPFFSVYPTQTTLPITVSPNARVSLPALANMDPILAPMSMPAIGVHAANVAAGVLVS